MKRRGFPSVLVVFMLLSLPYAAAGQVKVRSLSVGFASAVSSGGGFGMKATAGEPSSGLTQGEFFKIGAGFLYADTEAKVPEAIEFDVLPTGELPAEFQLHQNYPNPFNPVTSILISIPQHSSARLEVYNMIGQLVAVLLDQDLAAGTHRVEWDARDVTGRDVASGVYVYRLVAGDFSKTKTMVLLK
jgi:hypothetical protein